LKTLLIPGRKGPALDQSEEGYSFSRAGLSLPDAALNSCILLKKTNVETTPGKIKPLRRYLIEVQIRLKGKT